MNDEQFEIADRPVDDPACWTSAELGASTAWQIRLTDADRAELDQALAHVRKQKLSILEVTKADFPLRGLAQKLADVRREILEGRGFVLLRGVAVAR